MLRPHSSSCARDARRRLRVRRALAGGRPAGFRTLRDDPAHFVVHYTSDPTDPAYATQTQASDARRPGRAGATTTETGWGYQAPPDDGDGHTDIYIEDLSATDVLAFTQPDAAASTSTGYIVFGRGSSTRRTKERRLRTSSST